MRLFWGSVNSEFRFRLRVCRTSFLKQAPEWTIFFKILFVFTLNSQFLHLIRSILPEMWNKKLFPSAVISVCQEHQGTGLDPIADANRAGSVQWNVLLTSRGNQRQNQEISPRIGQINPKSKPFEPVKHEKQTLAWRYTRKGRITRDSDTNQGGADNQNRWDRRNRWRLHRETTN